MKTICIAGKNDIAVNVLQYCVNKYPACKIVGLLNKNEKGINSWQKSYKWYAEKYNIEILGLKEVYDIEDMVFLSLEYDRIIDPSKFKTTELYNIHFSLLPMYKGMYTSALPILNGEKFTGVTLHRINAGIDTGEIIAQKKFEIEFDDCGLDLYKKYISNGTEIIIENLDDLILGKVKSYPQSKIGSSYFSKSQIDYSNLQLNVNKTAYQIHNQIMAFSFRPYQLLKWNGVKYIDCEILDIPSSQKPGTVLKDCDIYTEIATIDYDVKMYKDVLPELFEAIKKGDNEKAKKLCATKKTVEAAEEHGWSALTIAVYNNNFELVKFLLDLGADKNIVNNNGTTLLMYAKDCYQNTGDSKIFEFLYNIEANVQQRDYYGKSLFDYCKEQNICKIGSINIDNNDLPL